LLESALAAGAGIESVYVSCQAVDQPGLAPVLARARSAGARLFVLAPGVLERVADTVTPQPLLSVLRTPEHGGRLPEVASFVVVCVDIRDPGNAGAVTRVADAAGADAVVCTRGTADPYGPKTVRASAGSVLHLPVVTAGEPDEALDDLGRRGLRRLAAVAAKGTPYTEVDLTGPLALVLGNETTGLPEPLDRHLDERITVPMGGHAESLNVSAAAAVLCFEVRRQRSSNLRAMDRAGQRAHAHDQARDQ